MCVCMHVYTYVCVCVVCVCMQRYLGYLCILVVSYGLSINLTEVIWKKMVKEAHPNKKEYQVSYLLIRLQIHVHMHMHIHIHMHT